MICKHMVREGESNGLPLQRKIATQSGKNRQNVRNRSGMWINSLKTELLLLFFSRS